MPRTEAVKELFENTGLYLTYDYNLRIRTETVQEFTRQLHFQAVLDVPCGTGAISLPLLNHIESLTCIDISSNMLSLAKKNTQAGLLSKVTFINQDIFKTNLPGHSFDLVICMGLLAHINSPAHLLERIHSLIRPGGYLILQNTDSSHFYSYLIRAYLALKNLISRQPYPLTRVSSRFITEITGRHGLQAVRTYRYNQSFLGFSNLFSNEQKYNLTRRLFGDAAHPRNQSFGSDYTYLFQKTV